MVIILMYLILGAVQGFTEPIPISSSGHVLIFQTILEKFNSGLNVDFELLAIMTNFGSLLAIMFFYRKMIIDLIKSFFTFIFKKAKRQDEEIKNNYKYCFLIVIATIPAAIMGIVVTKLGLLDALEEDVRFVGLMLVVTALFLFMIKDFKGIKTKDRINFKDAIFVGLAQMVALVPGISRSGATIVGSMFRGLKRDVAFDFSFILYIPVSIGTTILGVKDLLEMSVSTMEWVYYLGATLVACLFTFITTKWFSNIVKKGKLIYFSLYCLIVGILVIIFL